jgi:hypothetical protein
LITATSFAVLTGFRSSAAKATLLMSKATRIENFMLTSGTKRSRRNERFIQPRMKHDSEDYPQIPQILKEKKM